MYNICKFREELQPMTGVTYICNHYFDLTSSKMMTGREKAGSLSVHTDDALLLHGHTAREPRGQKRFVLTKILNMNKNNAGLAEPKSFWLIELIVKTSYANSYDCGFIPLVGGYRSIALWWFSAKEFLLCFVILGWGKVSPVRQPGQCGFM